MNIPQLHTNLLWDLSCLIIFLTGLYYSCLAFFRSPLWKSAITSACFSEASNLRKLAISTAHWDQIVNTSKDMDNLDKSNDPENVSMEANTGKDIHELEVDYEVVLDPIIKLQIHEILESYSKEQREKENLYQGDKGEEDKYEGEMIHMGNMALPPARFYSSKENKRVKLLYTIAELGDLREVPLLQGMLDQETNESISIIIKEIILRFLSEARPNSVQEAENPQIEHFGEHYVYKYLFEAIDTESQHLLLDEILKIGGLEELNFLRNLNQHPDQGIRVKARSFGNQLNQKLHFSDFLQIDFELDIAETKGVKMDGEEENMEISRSNRFLPLNQLIPMVLNKIGKFKQF